MIDIFEKILKIDAENQERQSRLRAQERIRPRCGNCFKWMKSSLCPKEVNIRGQHTGPNLDGIACELYERDLKK